MPIIITTNEDNIKSEEFAEWLLKTPQPCGVLNSHLNFKEAIEILAKDIGRLRKSED